MHIKSLAFLRCLILILSIPLVSKSQTFTPVSVTGFNQDVIAESGTSSLTTTTTALDAVPASNHVMYSAAFRTANGFGGGGIPDNGTIVNGTSTYQLANYNGNNALLLPRSQSGTLTLVTPAQFSALRVLCFSTEGPSLVSAVINFSNGTTTAVPSFTLNDWFNSTTNLVLSGFGRCTRATPTGAASDYPTNPRFYYADIPISCADRQKNVQSITINNITTAGTNAPFPDAVFFALSGTGFSQTITPAITNATCSNNGSVTLTITGSTSPYTVVWNTTPVQNGPTASNLPPGTYQATITDAQSCSVVFPVTITQQNTLTLTGNTNSSVCAGSSFNTTTTSNATTFAWTANTAPAVAGISNTAIANPVLTPTQTTTYTLTASTGSCTLTNSFTITVNPLPTVVPAITNATCSTNGSVTLTLSGATSPYTVVWNTSPVQNGVTATNLPPGTYQATVADANSCSVVFPVTITQVNNLTLTGNTNTAVCAGSSFNTTTTTNATTFAWTANTAPAVAGISNTAIANPVLTPAQTTTYTLTATSGSCMLTNSFTITVNPLPTISNRGPLNICTGTAGAGPALTSNGTSFHWSPTAGVSDPTVLNPVLNPTATTPYTVTATLGGCSASTSFTAVVSSVTANAGNPVTILQGGSTTLSGSGSIGTYQWTPSTGLSDPTILTPVATPQTTTPYTLTVTTAAGCVATSTVTVTVLPQCIIPFKAFTPNGDGFHDKWVLTQGSCTKNIRVLVYNRYGSKVYESQNYNNDWDGTYKGKPLPDATYYYVVTFTMITGEVRIMKGDVAIIR